MSQWTSSPRHPAFMTRQTWVIDQLFLHHTPGVACTVLNPGYFADNYLRVSERTQQAALTVLRTHAMHA
jgi:NAD(P)H dehydrogenase (quinone)